MYYLLEDNRIIDSENYKEPYILSKDVIRNREILFLTSFKDQVSVKGVIKKQSENVYDLIEVGDLIKFYKYIDGVRTKKTITSQVCNNFEGSAFTYGDYTFHCDILTIYKPNEKGDYIKVWEKKDE